MTIEPDGDGFKVLGRPSVSNDSEEKDNGAKREREEETAELNKRVKLDEEDREKRSRFPLPGNGVSAEASGPLRKKEDLTDVESLPPVKPSNHKGKGDVFLAEGIREKLAATLDVSPPNEIPLIPDGNDRHSPIRSDRQRDLRASTR